MISKTSAKILLNYQKDKGTHFTKDKKKKTLTLSVSKLLLTTAANKPPKRCYKNKVISILLSSSHTPNCLCLIVLHQSMIKSKTVSKQQVFNNDRKYKYSGTEFWEPLTFLITYDRNRSTFGPLRPWKTTGGLYTFITPSNLYTYAFCCSWTLYLWSSDDFEVIYKY